MQIRVMGILVVLMAALLAVGCGGQKSGQSDSKYDLSYLGDGFANKYQMRQGDQVRGTMKQTVKRETRDGKEVIVAGFDVYGQLSGHSELVFDANSADPISIDAEQSFGQMSGKTQITYGDTSLTRIISSSMSPKADTSTVSHDSGTLDWMQITYILPALDLTPGSEHEVVFRQSFGNTQLDTAKIHVVGREQIEVPAGPFEATKVSVEYLGNTTHFFYGDAPEYRQLLQLMETPRGDVRSELLPEDAVLTEDGQVQADTTEGG